mgnify:CR=1 FL=1
MRARDAVAEHLATGSVALQRSRRRDGAGWVALVGGGPGTDALLTIRGRHLLSTADVVVVDRLAPRGLLADLPASVRIVDVGKVPGRHAVTQDEINAVLVEEALAGHGKGHEMMLSGLGEHNLAFRLAEWLHYAEEALGVGTLVLYDYSGCRMLGDWLVQLYTESIQERGGGLNVIAARGPTSNHSLLNGVIGGPRDKAVLFIRWGELGTDVHVPSDAGIKGGLEVFMDKSMKRLQDASCDGTITDFGRNGIPALVLTVPQRDTYHLFWVMRLLMDMVAVKGRLQGLHVDASSQVNYPAELTYQQDGVEGYKQAMRDCLLT